MCYCSFWYWKKTYITMALQWLPLRNYLYGWLNINKKIREQVLTYCIVLLMDNIYIFHSYAFVFICWQFQLKCSTVFIRRLVILFKFQDSTTIEERHIWFEHVSEALSSKGKGTLVKTKFNEVDIWQVNVCQVTETLWSVYDHLSSSALYCIKTKPQYPW